MNDQWAKWVHETTGGASSRVIAGKIDRSHTTALKWMHDPSPDAVMAFAHAYGANVIEALIAAGWLNDVEESERAIVRKLPSVKLTAELYRRALVHEQARQRKA